MIIRPRNWKSFQHYNDRKPAWIKLHRELLDNYDYHRLPDASAALAPKLWLLASESDDGAIDADLDKLAFRLRRTSAEIDAALKPLIAANFFEVLQDAIAVLAGGKRGACLERETEEEEETEEERDARARKVSRGAQDAGDALTGMSSAESMLAEMNDAWKRDVDGVNVEALQGFIDFVAKEINPPSKRREFSPSARISLAKRLAGMGDDDQQEAVVEQSISADHAVLYALKDRPSKGAASTAQVRKAEQREFLGLRTRAGAIGFRGPHRGEDLGDYRARVGRAETEAKDKVYRDGLAKKKSSTASAAELFAAGAVPVT